MKTTPLIPVSIVALVLVFADATRSEEPGDSTHSGVTEELMLVVGQQLTFDATDVDSFSESTRGVIGVKVPKDGRKLIVTALRPGTTSLLLIDKSGDEKTIVFTVFSRMPETIQAELETLFGETDGVSLRQVGPRIFMDGTVATEGELRRIEQAVKAYKGQAVSLVSVDPNVVQPKTNIRLDLTFVELRNSDTNRFGLAWPASFGGTGLLQGELNLLTGSMSAMYQVVDQAMPSLEAAARYGWVKIRKRATVVTTSGNRAAYRAGGEVNVAVAGSQAAEIRSIPYGAQLAVTPRLAKNDALIDLEVSAEISELAETTQNVPGRIISKVETLVHLGLGQSIMLSGLDSESESITKEGIPVLSKIPILGLLFGSRSHEEKQAEGIIVITPTVLDHVDRVGRQLLENALEKFEKFEGDFD